ncbi:MAG: TonB-dependent receptor plug domain-containing protein, partial [Opitutaceae bacterium]
MKTTVPLRLIVILIALGAPLCAQLAPASSPTASTAKDDPVKLGVFEVNATNDDEYRAANTTSGTRYNTPVKDLPMNIEVLTSSFMRDIGALDVRDALEYVSGIQLDSSGSAGTSKQNPENNQLLIRGITAASNKDGFRRFVPMDPITTSRVDVIKGPGGALYGQGGTGGVVNVSSVQAGDRTVARTGVSIGSFDYRRFELLWSGPVTPKGTIGFALPLAYSSNESNALYYKINTFVMNPSLTFKLGPKTKLLVAIESRFATRDNFFGSQIITDN